MPPQLATVVYSLGILGLFALDREGESRTSPALWIPTVWLWIVGSREVSLWLAAFGITQSQGFSGSQDQYPQYPEGSPIDRAVYAGLLLLGVIVLIRRGPRVRRIISANAPILLFFLYCAASVCWSDYPDIAFKRWIKALGDLAMVLIVLTDAERNAAIKRVLTRTGFVLLPVSILLIKYYTYLGRGYHEAAWGYTGVTTNKNTLGMVCLFIGIGTLWQVLEILRNKTGTRRAKSLIAQGAVLVMALELLWLSNSMTSLACFALGGSLMVLTSLFAQFRKRAVVHALVAGALAVSSASLFLSAGGDVLKEMGRDSSLTGRTEVWSTILQMNENPLVGNGFESFWLGSRLETLWSKYWWHPNEAHNGYLEIFLNLGWLGLALLTVLVISGYRNILAMLRWEPSAGTLRLAYFVVALTYSFTEAGFRMLNPIWIFFLLAVTALPDAPMPNVAATWNAESLHPWPAAASSIRLKMPQSIQR